MKVPWLLGLVTMLLMYTVALALRWAGGAGDRVQEGRGMGSRGIGCCQGAEGWGAERRRAEGWGAEGG